MNGWQSWAAIIVFVATYGLVITAVTVTLAALYVWLRYFALA